MGLSTSEKLNRYQNRKSKKKIFDRDKITERALDGAYFHAMDVYNETGNFAVLAHAFFCFNDSGYQMPVELSNALNKHLSEFAFAENKEKGLDALGFNSNKNGGAWHGQAAIKALNKAALLKYIEQAKDDLEWLRDRKATNVEVIAMTARVFQVSKAIIKKIFYDKQRVTQP